MANPGSQSHNKLVAVGAARRCDCERGNERTHIGSGFILVQSVVTVFAEMQFLALRRSPQPAANA